MKVAFRENHLFTTVVRLELVLILWVEIAFKTEYKLCIHLFLKAMRLFTSSIPCSTYFSTLPVTLFTLNQMTTYVSFRFKDYTQPHVFWFLPFCLRHVRIYTFQRFRWKRSGTFYISSERKGEVYYKSPLGTHFS